MAWAAGRGEFMVSELGHCSGPGGYVGKRQEGGVVVMGEVVGR